MSNVATAAGAAQATAAAEKVEAGKEAIYEALGEMIKDKTGKRVGKTGGREVFDFAIENIIALAIRQGTVRLNGGFGSFHVREYSAGTRKLPSGQDVTFDKRSKLRYEEGVVTKELVSNGGDLVKAVKVRGTRAKTDAAPATAADPAKPTPVPAAAKPKAGVELD